MLETISNKQEYQTTWIYPDMAYSGQYHVKKVVQRVENMQGKGGVGQEVFKAELQLAEVDPPFENENEPKVRC